jgi:hypothetical protein
MSSSQTTPTRRQFKEYIFNLHGMPVLLDCNFVVDSTNGNGLGLRNLKGPGIAAVYMHTSASPAPGNPNPAPGYFEVQFDQSYFRYYGGFEGFVAPVSGTPLTSTTAGTAYVIVSLGTTTTAQWQAAGLPVGVVPAVGAAFIATATGAIGGTGAVEVPSTNGSGVGYVELVGDPNMTLIMKGPQQRNPYLIGRFMGGTPPVATAPADGSVCGMAFYLSNSSQTLQGE